jgi:hypothetical protein
MTKEAEACEQSSLSMVVAEAVKLGVAQACAGDKGGGVGEEEGNTQCEKQAVAAMMSNQQQVRAAPGIPRGRSSKPRCRQAGKVSVEMSGGCTGG